MITYKNITDVEVLEQASENTKVLVNEGGELMQAPYSNFEDKMSNAEVLEEIPENAKVLVEENGALKKVPCTRFGGGNKNDIIINYDDSTGECSCNTEYADFVDMYNKRELPLMLCWIVNTDSRLNMCTCESVWLRQGDTYGLEFYQALNGGEWVEFTWDPSGVSINNEPK